MNHLRWTVSGLALGLFLALAPSCGQSAKTCNASNCSGCCDANGECQLGNSASACGLFGGACLTCGALDNCQGGYCIPATGGNNPDGGNPGGPGCTPSNCAGCCAGNTCIAPGSISNLTCGKAGEACTSCTGTTSCDVGTGVCKDPTCNGCMDGSTCRPTSQQGSTACGSGGSVCKACGAGESCVNGSCQPAAGCGPANCNGCCSATGACVTATTNQACGANGNACVACPSGQTCSGGVCTPTTPTTTVGIPCSTNSQCSAIGTGATCRLATASGNATYSQGYCTKPCNMAGACGTGAECLGLFELGEEPICFDLCTPNGSDTCRPGYECYPLDQAETTGMCWISPMPSPPTPPSNVVGNACTSEANCNGGGSYPAGYCITQWTSGYCTGECTLTGSCASDATCVGFQDPMTKEQFSLCMERCSTPGGGQGTCRSGYTCQDDGAGGGFCFPPAP